MGDVVSQRHTRRRSLWTGQEPSSDDTHNNRPGVYCRITPPTHRRTNTHTFTQDEGSLSRLCYNLGCIPVKMLNGEEFSDPLYYTVFLNGSLLGVTRQYTRMVQLLRYDSIFSLFFNRTYYQCFYKNTSK